MGSSYRRGGRTRGTYGSHGRGWIGGEWRDSPRQPSSEFLCRSSPSLRRSGPPATAVPGPARQQGAVPAGPIEGLLPSLKEQKGLEDLIRLAWYFHFDLKSLFTCSNEDFLINTGPSLRVIITPPNPIGIVGDIDHSPGFTPRARVPSPHSVVHPGRAFEYGLSIRTDGSDLSNVPNGVLRRRNPGAQGRPSVHWAHTTVTRSRPSSTRPVPLGPLGPPAVLRRLTDIAAICLDRRCC